MSARTRVACSCSLSRHQRIVYRTWCTPTISVDSDRGANKSGVWITSGFYSGPRAGEDLDFVLGNSIKEMRKFMWEICAADIEFNKMERRVHQLIHYNLCYPGHDRALLVFFPLPRSITLLDFDRAVRLRDVMRPLRHDEREQSRLELRRHLLDINSVRSEREVASEHA